MLSKWEKMLEIHSVETETIVEEQLVVSGFKGITDFGLDDIKFDT